MDAAILDIFRRVSAEENAAKAEELKAKTSKQLGKHFHRHPQELQELAFELLNVAWKDVLNEDVVPRIIEVKTVGLGDVDYYEEDLRGGRAYWQGKGGQILSDIIRYERSVMPREEMVTALDFHQDEVALDFWGTFDRLARQAREKLRGLPTARLVELVQTAVTSGPYYAQYAASTLTDDQVDAVVDEVAAKTDGQLTIVGTRIATRKLAKVGLNISDNIAEQFFRTGTIGVYKGYPVVQVSNSEDFNGNFVLPNDELWIVGRNAGRLTYYGNSPKVQQLDLKAFMKRWETARDAGMALFGADFGRIGRIKLT